MTPSGIVNLKLSHGVSLAAVVALCLAPAARAATPHDILIQVGEHGPNALDDMVPAANELSQMVSWNIYDRLVTHGVKTLPDGKMFYDMTKMLPEAATSWDIADDGKTMTFHLRPDATFHTGNPVTAADVKWSFDRAIAVGGFPAVQMAAGSMTSPDQFSVVDPHTFRITFDRPNKLTLPDLVVPVPNILDAKEAKKHATADDPWALNWTREHDLGGGPFKIRAWQPGNQTVFERFDNWKSGPLPAMRRVVYREVASAGTRRALLEKGDVDVSTGLPPKDFAELAAAGKVNVIGTLMQNELFFVDINVTVPPFDNLKVRQAAALAMPYDSIMSQALYNRGVKMWGGDASAPFPPVWPTPSHVKPDLDQAKKLLTEAGFPNGFDTTLYFDLNQSTVQEPMALLMQEQLGKIGIRLAIEKVPGAEWFARMGAKKMPMVINYFYGWLDTPEYFFFWTYDGKNNSVFNTANYQNPAVDALIEKARFETDPAGYKQEISQMIGTVMADMPRIPVAHLFSDVALQKNVKGYVYWFHTAIDYRAISKN